MYGGKFGLATLLISDQCFKLKDRGGSKRDVQQCLFGTTLVMSVYAPDCGKDLGVERHKFWILPKSCGKDAEGAREFYITGYLTVEVGFWCTDEEDIEEFNEMYRPLVLARVRKRS